MLFIYARTNLRYFIANRFNGEYMHFCDDFEEALLTFQQWVQECGLTAKQMWFANVFDVESGDHVATLTIKQDGSIVYEAVDNSPIEMGSYTIKQLVKYVI